MKPTCCSVLLAIALAVPSLTSALVIPATGRIDHVHDFKRNRVYITAGDSVLRYDRASSSFLAPIAIPGAALRGVDISLDGDQLAVADNTLVAGQVVVHLVDLNTLAITERTDAAGYYEAGSWSVAFGADGSVLASSNFNGSGWVPLRKWDATGGVTYVLNPISQQAMIAASGDRTRAGFAEANISSGQWGRYSFATGVAEEMTGYDRGTSWFNFEIGANRGGTQFAIPTYGGTFFYDDTLTKVATIGTYGGPSAIGVAYHPVENRAYFPWTGTNEVKIYDTTSFTEVGSVPTSQTFSWQGNAAYQLGRTKLSIDGSVLLVSVADGVEVIDQYAPLTTNSFVLYGKVNQTSTVTLPGSIGNNGQLTWSIGTPPRSGTVSLSGPVATYTPNAGFTGSDPFTFVVRYGEAEVEGTADIEVLPNYPPTAFDQSAATDEDTDVLIPLSASDPEGNPLTWIYQQPANGSFANWGPGFVTYRPKANFNGTDSFTFFVNDGSSNSNTATVSVNVRPVNDAPIAKDSTVQLGENGTINACVEATDVEGSTLTYRVVTPAQHGTFTQLGSGMYCYTYTPATNWYGTDTVQWVANDGDLDSNVATITFLVSHVNQAPTAQSFSVSTNRDTPVAISLRGSDVDGDALVYWIAQYPSNGTFTGSPPDITYTPRTGFVGQDAIAYRAQDPQGLQSATAIVSINVIAVNRPPVAVNDAASVKRGNTVIIQVLANDSDPDGDALAVESVTQPSAGTASVSSNAVKYVASGARGTYTFQYTINDGHGARATANVTVTVN